MDQARQRSNPVDTQRLMTRVRKLEQENQLLRENEAHVQSLMDSAQDFVVYRLQKDPTYPFRSRVVFVSPSIRNIMGVRDPWDFASWFDCIDEQDLPKVVDAEQRCAPERAQFNQIMRIFHPGQQQHRWIQAISSPVFDASGEVTHYNGLIVDVTAIYEAKEAAKADKERFENLFEYAPVALFKEDFSGIRVLIDALKEKGVNDIASYCNDNPAFVARCARSVQVVTANQAAVELYGCRNKTELLEKLSQIMPESTWQGFQDEIIAFATGKKLVQRETIDCTLWGEEIKVFVLVNMFCDRARPDDVIVSIIHITEKRRLQESLLLRERAIESSSNAIIISAGEQLTQRIVYANSAFEKLTGYLAAEAIGFGNDPSKATNAGDSGLRDIYNILHSSRQHKFTVQLKRKNKTRFWCEFNIVPVCDHAGQSTRFISIMNDVTDKKTYEEQLFYKANYDALTALPNRTLLQTRLDQAVQNADQDGHSVAVIFIDLDNFKYINDSLGHEAGDQALEAVAKRLQSCLRDDDFVSRQGGDEFVLILSEQAVNTGVEKIIRRIFSEISAPLVLANQTLQITCSAGYAVYPDVAKNASDLIKYADTAMYKAKASGRNNYQGYTEDLGSRIRERLSLESYLRRALEYDELFLVYQPQIDLSTGAICGMESLLRWRHPKLGLVSPLQFIGLAEELGLIEEIGRWVLHTACAQYMIWQDLGFAPARISVNVSARQFWQDDLADLISQTLHNTSMEGCRLDIELTESVVMHDPQEILLQLQKIKTLGLQLSIDDFGTGYSSLSYLSELPVDRLKIDRSFIGGLQNRDNNSTIVKAVIALGHSLGIEVLAEGVENTAQLEFLVASQCNEVQGYLFSRPLMADAASELIRSHQQPILPSVATRSVQ